MDLEVIMVINLIELIEHMMDYIHIKTYKTLMSIQK